jgi:predicted metalloprotease
MKPLAFFLAFLLLGLVSLPKADAQEWDLDELVELAALDINDFWKETFDEIGERYIEPEVEIFTRAEISTGCGRIPAEVGPFYCPPDHQIYLPEWFMEYQLENVGDFAVVVILAHEWGHAIQNIYSGARFEFSILTELQADCFAGAYTRHAADFSENVQLSEGDLQEGVVALYFAGDLSTDWFDETAHGDSQQRLTMFLTGFQDGYQAC